MNERRVNELYISLHACDESMRKRLERYNHDYKVANLEETLKRLDKMSEYIGKMREEISGEIERRRSIL